MRLRAQCRLGPVVNGIAALSLSLLLRFVQRFNQNFGFGFGVIFGITSTRDFRFRSCNQFLCLLLHMPQSHLSRLTAKIRKIIFKILKIHIFIRSFCLCDNLFIVADILIIWFFFL